MKEIKVSGVKGDGKVLIVDDEDFDELSQLVLRVLVLLEVVGKYNSK